jgi:hypothetical protein
MTDSPGSGQITQENFCLALQCDSIENDTHGHDSCLEDPFIDFDGVDSLICSVIVFSESQSLATSVDFSEIQHQNPSATISYDGIALLV